MTTQFIIDEQSVASASGVSFHLNQARKHPQNPLLIPGEPHQWDSLQIIWPGTVLFDAGEKLYRCWYHGADAVQKDRPAGVGMWTPGYAQSEDGVHWTKPLRNEMMHRGRPTNRIVNDWGGMILCFVTENPDRTDRNHRFLSFWKTAESWAFPQLPRAFATSPDGIHWNLKSNAIYREPPPRNQMQDFWQVLFEPNAIDPNYRCLAYSQYWDKREWDGKLVRKIGLHHGPDLASLKDADPAVVLGPERGIDEELHFATVAHIGQTYLMFFESDRFSSKPLNGDVRLAVSADGKNFRRVHPTQSVIPTGSKGMWDENLIVTTSYMIQEVGDEYRLYYFGCPNLFCNWPGGYEQEGLKGSHYYPSYLGLATLPRDRFAYAKGPGRFTIEAKAMRDRQDVWINSEGDISLRALDKSGDELASGHVGTEVMQSVYRQVVWSNRAKLSQATAMECNLRNDAKVFSIRN